MTEMNLPKGDMTPYFSHLCNASDFIKCMSSFVPKKLMYKVLLKILIKK